MGRNRSLAATFVSAQGQSREAERRSGFIGSSVELAGAGISNAGRPRLMIRLQYQKHSFNLSDEELVERWSENVVVDTTVQEKAIAYPVDSRLLEIARHKVVHAAKRVGISLK